MKWIITFSEVCVTTVEADTYLQALEKAFRTKGQRGHRDVLHVQRVPDRQQPGLFAESANSGPVNRLF